MSGRLCNVCRSSLNAPIYVSPSAVSITSLCEVIPKRTEVFFCAECGHLVTPELEDLSSYYGDDYKILLASEDEDQLYEQGPNGQKTYRTDHQLGNLLEKIPLSPGARALDWGSAKGAMFRRLAMQRPDLALHLFDVSDMYVPFWERFCEPGHWATFTPPTEWASSFDLVTSFYSLEHVAAPREAIETIARLLAPKGRLYIVVPDTYQNTGDFVVVDHVNHFSRWSLERLLTDAGLIVLEIDEAAHQSAIVAIAEKPVARSAVHSTKPPAELAGRVATMAEFWQGFGERVRAQERLRGDWPSAIYGSGFYGAFISTCLTSAERVAAFLDQNPFRQAQTLFAKPILAPEALPADVRLVYVGLNPAYARNELAKVTAWRDRPLELFFP
jgi:SAM-dependent methyltransferase